MYYRITHPTNGETVHFDSWMTLCEYALDVAEAEAQRRLTERMMQLTSEIADEIMLSAEECEAAEYELAERGAR